MLARIALLTLIFSPLVWAANTLVTLENSAPLELCPSCTDLTVLIKTGEKAIQASEQPEVEAVYLGGDRKDSANFKAKWVGEGKPRSINIGMDIKSLAQAGTYDIYLNLQPKSDPSAERLKVQVIHVQPKIAAVPKLIVDRTYFFPGLKSDTKPDVIVLETSRKSSITNLILLKTANASIGTKPIGGTLEFTLVPEIKAGEPKKLEYKVANDFDIGTSTGALKIESNETVDGLGSLDFEVRTHFHWIYIGLTIALGLLCSYFLKVDLQQRIELDQARLDARKLESRVLDEQEGHADEAFRNAYRNQLTALDTALDGDSPQAINDAKLALDTAWRAALQDLLTRHQQQQAEFDKLRDITNYNWLVPPTVSDPITVARNAQAAAYPLLKGDNLEQFRIQLTQIRMDLGNGVLQAALLWLSNERQILDDLQKKPNGISEAISEELAKHALDLSGSLVKVAGNTPVGSCEQIQQVLNDVQGERLSVSQFVVWLKNVLAMELAHAVGLIKQAHVANWKQDVFDALPVAEDRLSAFFDGIVDVPEPKELAAQLDAVHQAWIDALQGQLSKPDATVQALLDGRKYVDALNATIGLIPKPSGPLGSVAAPATAPAPFGVPTLLPGGLGPTHTSVSAFHSYFQTLFAPSPATRTPATDEQQLKRGKRRQTLLIGLLLVLAGYGLQLSTFVGTFADFSTLFFWAFGLDLTVDAVRNITRK